MKKNFLLLSLVVLVFSGCATSYTPLVGTVFSSDVKGPVTATANERGEKTGTATANMIFGISYGDGSIQTAARNGGISKIKTVDIKVTHILNVYVEATTIVTGD